MTILAKYSRGKRERFGENFSAKRVTLNQTLNGV